MLHRDGPISLPQILFAPCHTRLWERLLVFSIGTIVGGDVNGDSLLSCSALLLCRHHICFFFHKQTSNLPPVLQPMYLAGAVTVAAAPTPSLAAPSMHGTANSVMLHFTLISGWL